MERTVPSTETEEVELYLRTYYSLLRSTAEVQIRTLEEAHTGMKSLLHPGAREPQPDMAAFIYTLLRLPDCMTEVQVVVLGQSAKVFSRGGYGDVFQWQEVSAPARRRRCFFDRDETLACFIASRSDIDDMIPIMTAYQIEWNKLHYRLRNLRDDQSLDRLCRNLSQIDRLADILEVSQDDLERLYAIWGDGFCDNLKTIAEKPRSLRVRLLSGSLSEYRRATHAWWNNIEESAPELTERPIYFVSSNNHSFANLLSGFALRQEERLVEFLQRSDNAGLLNEWNEIESQEVPTSRENFLYYVYKKYLQTPEGRELKQEQRQVENQIGIQHIPSRYYFDVEAQVFDLSALNLDHLDPRLKVDGLEHLKESNALILNIDYPLGLAAYNILSEIAERAGTILGVYVMGKAATLNSTIGDVMIPNVVHDEHSQNSFLFANCFSAAEVSPFLIFGTVLDNQKAVTVQGTFLQTAHYMDVFYREGYTDIEMEAGPYLSAVYEMYRPKRHPINEIVNLYEVPFDLGILHYASDTPLSKGKNLGAGSLSYFGMDSTYAAAVAILRRTFELEGKGFRRP